MKNRDQIIQEIQALINDLGLPLSQTDEAVGWTIEAQKATLNLLKGIHTTIIEHRPIANLSIGRGLDHWGVEGGFLFERACALSNNLREMDD